MRYKEHKAKWNNCKNCSLCEVRRKVVLAKGKLKPCDVLFIGEAPGMSEDVLGTPFVGPAGKLLQRMVDAASSKIEGEEIRCAYTNVISCIPRESKGKGKVANPPEDSVHACQDRLVEFVEEVCKPKNIIYVGKFAADACSTLFIDRIEECETIYHPAFILRKPVLDREVYIQHNTDIIDRVFSSTLCPF